MFKLQRYSSFTQFQGRYIKLLQHKYKLSFEMFVLSDLAIKQLSQRVFKNKTSGHSYSSAIDRCKHQNRLSLEIKLSENGSANTFRPGFSKLLCYCVPLRFEVWSCNRISSSQLSHFGPKLVHTKPPVGIHSLLPGSNMPPNGPITDTQ